MGIDVPLINFVIPAMKAVWSLGMCTVLVLSLLMIVYNKTSQLMNEDFYIFRNNIAKESFGKNTKSTHQYHKYIDQELIQHFLPRNADPNRYMIYFCYGRCGGLADRQKGIVGSYLMALLTGRTFGINITSPCDLTRHYSPNLLNWVINPNSLKGLTTQRYADLGGFNFLNEMHTTDLDKYFQEDVIYFKGNIEYVTEIRKHPSMSKVVPYMAFLQNPDVYSIILHILFLLAPRVSHQLNSLLNGELKNSHLVCAHIRLGRNPTMLDTKKQLRIHQTSAIWPFLDKYKNQEGYRIFVASDSNEIRDIARRKYGSQNVEVPGPIVHIDRRNYSAISKEATHAIQTEGMDKVVIEQRLLQHCHTLIITKSGFNLIAVYMRNHSENLYCLLGNQVFPCVRELVFNIFPYRAH